MKNSTLRIIFIVTLITSILPVAGAASQKAAAENTTAYSIYITKKGDTLQSVAGKRQIYGIPLKWPLIYFLNKDDLNALGLPPAELPAASLPPGLALAYLRSEEAEKKKALLEGTGKRWVVNIISSVNQREIYSPAIKLLENGYFAYISDWSYKGKSWKRLRAGFYKDQQTAAEAGKSIIKLLNLKTFWAVEGEWKEVNEYIGFAESLIP